MICGTVKVGQECVFMTKKGCQFNGGSCHPIIAQCEGCQKVGVFPNGKYCISFPDPAAKWRLGTCNMATHVVKEVKKPVQKLNPLKASKRGAH